MNEGKQTSSCEQGRLITSWGQVRLVCPCGGNPELSYDFDIIKRGKEVVYTCTNSSCPNSFSSDILTKIIDWLNDYYQKHGTLDGFRRTFAYHNRKIRIRYIDRKQITETYTTIEIEIWSSRQT